MIKRLLILTSLLAIVTGFLAAQNLHHLDKDLPCLNKTFNLHVHVALDFMRRTNFEQEVFEAMLEIANEQFEPICVSFKLCEYDTILNYNFDRPSSQAKLDEIRTLFAHERRLNVYVVEVLDDPQICGYGGQDIFLRKGCGSFTLVHELGHVFGLPHTFAGNGEELVDGSNCGTAGDGICDTPADPYDLDIVALNGMPYHTGCEFVYPNTDGNGQYYQPDMGNIMSYYPCPCGFTRGQYLRMVETIENGKIQLW